MNKSKLIIFGAIVTAAVVGAYLGLRGTRKAFDPWSYDFDGDGLINRDEYLAAVNDYYDLKITKAQVDQVGDLYNGQIHR
jgi:hypothetical protein